ncbi:MAG: choice-of-anchor L domain-containing protein [Flavobacteriales bacterium]
MNTTLRILLSLFMLVFGAELPLKCQIQIQPSNHALNLAQYIMGNGVSIINANLQAHNHATAFFNAENANLGLNEGLIFSTGSAPTTDQPILFVQGCPLVPGISNPMNSYAFASTNLDLYPVNIPEINDIIPSSLQKFDVVKLSIQFIALESTLSFQYVFASEEFPIWLNTFFTDFFVIAISGPGINGIQNIAKLPDNQYVSVNTIGNSFNNNETSNTWHAYNGYSPVYVATVNLIPNQVYTIHFIIADASDSSYDSAVFIKKNQNSNNLQANIQTYQQDNTIIEGCTGAQVTFTRLISNDDSLWIYLQYEGTAQFGIDYPNLPDSILIPVGEISVMLSIDAFQDHLDEGIESLIIYYQSEINLTNSIYLYIRDQPNLAISLPDSLAFCSNNGLHAIHAQINSGMPPFEFTWNDTPSESSMYFFDTDSAHSQWVYLSVNDFCLNMINDSVYVDLFEAAIPLPPGLMSNSPVCADEELWIHASSEEEGTFQWSGPNNFSSADQSLIFPISQTEQSGVYEAYIDLDGCKSDVVSIHVTVHPKPGIPEFASSNPYCNGSNVYINAFVEGASGYIWSGPNGFSSTSPFNTINNAGAEHAGVYEVVASNQHGCTSEGSLVLQMLDVDNLIYYINSVLFTELSEYQSLQWLDCSNNFAPIPGETLPVFTLNQDGSYALQVTLEQCVDTSACFTFASINQAEHHAPIMTYPNPSNGWISFTNLSSTGIVELYDAQGRLVKTEFIEPKEILELQDLANGMYCIRLLQAEKQVYQGKIVLH